MLDRRAMLGMAAAGLGLGAASAHAQSRPGATATPYPAPQSSWTRPVVGSPTRAPASNLSPALASTLDSLRTGSSTVGGAIVAARGGQALASYYWGNASLAFNVPVSEQTLFHLGSNGKQLTAVAVAQLLGGRRIDLMSPIGDHLPNLPRTVASVPIDALLHHTSGLVDYQEVMPEWHRSQSRDVIEPMLREQPVLFQPGEARSYSNTNYLILGWLVEHLSNRPFADYLQTSVLFRSGAPSMRADATREVVPNRADAFEVDMGGAIRPAVRIEDTPSRAGDGCVLMAGQDVAPWYAAMSNSRLLTTTERERMLSPYRLTTGRLSPYGHAANLEQCRGQRLIRHGGAVPGFLCYSFVWPDIDLAIIAMTNSDGVNGAPLSEMVCAMAESLAPGVTWRDLPPLTNGSDARTRTLRSVLTRPGGASAPSDALAPEGRRIAEIRMRRASGLTDLRPIETWLAGSHPDEGELVRYRVVRGPRVTDMVVGWTPDDRIYWL